MEIRRSGSQPSAKGPEEYFTGVVRVDSLFAAPAATVDVALLSAERGWSLAGLFASPARGLVASRARLGSVLLVSTVVVLGSSAAAVRLLDRGGVA